MKKLGMQDEKIVETYIRLLVFFVPLTLFCLYRYGLTPLFNGDSWFFFFRNEYISLESAFKKNVNHQGFRPLSVFLENFGAYLYKITEIKIHYIFVIVIGIIYSSCNILIYTISRHLGLTIVSSFLAVILFCFSVATISGIWHNLYSLFQLGPLFFILLGLYSYFLLKGAGKKRNLVLLIFCMLVAPLFREYGFILSVIVFCDQLFLFVRRKPFGVLLLSISALGALYAVFITQIYAFVGLYDGHMNSLFSGDLTQRSVRGSSVGLLSIVKGLNYSRSGYIINQIPPSLLIVSIFGFGLLIYNKLYNKTLNLIDSHQSRFFLWFLPFLCLSCFSFWQVFIASQIVNNGLFFLNVSLLLIVVFSSVFLSSVIFFWFALSLAPLITIFYNHDQHLVFVMAPVSICIALGIQEGLRYLENSIKFTTSQVKKTLSFVLPVFIAFGTLDLVINPVTSFFATNSINNGHKLVATWLNSNIPKNALIITDTMGAQDIIYQTAFTQKELSLTFDWRHGQSLGTKILTQRNLINKARQSQQKVYYIHQTSKSTDHQLPLPLPILSLEKEITYSNFALGLDPLRLFSSIFRRQFAPSEWDTSYGWVGSSSNCCSWTNSINIYNLVYPDKVNIVPFFLKDRNRIKQNGKTPTKIILPSGGDPPILVDERETIDSITRLFDINGFLVAGEFPNKILSTGDIANDGVEIFYAVNDWANLK